MPVPVNRSPRGCGLGSVRVGGGVWVCSGPVGPTGSDPARGLGAYTDGVRSRAKRNHHGIESRLIGTCRLVGDGTSGHLTVAG